MFTPCNLYHTILLYYYAETKEMIYELVNLKGVVYEPKQNSFSLQSTARPRLQLHGAIYRPDSFVFMLRYCANLKAIRYE